MIGNDSLGLFVAPYKLSFIKSKHLIKSSLPKDDFMGVATDNEVTIYTLLLLRLEEILAKTEEGGASNKSKFSLRTSPCNNSKPYSAASFKQQQILNYERS